MNILLISQCSKNALTETRRIIDQFAERCGDRSWQTAITADGLATLKKMLKKTARKNTAVACHWVRGKNYTELLWIVGNQGRFNAQGSVPTNTTQRDVLRSQKENSWQTIEVIALLSSLAGLFHDFGKTNQLFQAKLQPGYHGKGSEPLRHEWLSLRLFLSFIGDDGDQQWLMRLSEVTPATEPLLYSHLFKDSPTSSRNPFKPLLNRPVALTVAWLIVCHHRLPQFSARQGSTLSIADIDKWMTGKQFKAGWNSPQLYNPDWTEQQWTDLWNLNGQTPLASSRWCAKAGRLATRALKHIPLFGSDWINDRFTSHLARLVLMLSDHCYSASEPTPLWQDSSYGLIANTDRQTRQPKQKLDEHNIGVAHNAYLISRRVPGLRRNLPAITRLKALKKRGTKTKYFWQNKAYDLATSIAHRSEQQGFFGVNMASTGCGKTFANARIMYGLADERKGCRFNVALGLRTLTLQTGHDLQQKLNLDEDDLAVLVGSQAVKILHDRSSEDSIVENSTGDESADEVLGAGQHLIYEGSLDDGLLKEWLQRSPKLHRLISAPVLVSTIDYLMPATEGGRGGQQIAPMLRLLTSDLVLDEPDDFGLKDLPALCRLVHWAGLLGSRVLLSSATLPPALLRALFDAYLIGRKEFNRACGELGQNLPVCCAWFDEFGAMQSDHHHLDSFSEGHNKFIRKRVAKLQTDSLPLRKSVLLPVVSPTPQVDDVTSSFAAFVHQQIYSLHKAHHQCHPHLSKTVSCGLVRMANINPLIAVSRALLQLPPPEDYRLHFCIYHGQYPLLMRSQIENVLDHALDRHDPNQLWAVPSITKALDRYPEQHHVFVVLGTSVTEVGRDHDYDWAIAEPSSMRSLIQLAGRIQRHRQQLKADPNLVISNLNIKALRGREIAYHEPGFESKSYCLTTKDLQELLLPEQYEQINSIPRILPRQELTPTTNLVDLEHYHLQACLFGHKHFPESANLWWQHNPGWCFELQRRTPFRQSAADELFILYLENEEDAPSFKQVRPDGFLLDGENRFERVELRTAERVSAWIEPDIGRLIVQLADEKGLELAACSRKFTEIRLREPQDVKIWKYHPLLGIFDSC